LANAVKRSFGNLDICIPQWLLLSTLYPADQSARLNTAAALSIKEERTLISLKSAVPILAHE
jgi:hypothetical protein